MGVPPVLIHFSLEFSMKPSSLKPLKNAPGMPARQAPTGRSCLSRADGGRREEMTSQKSGNSMEILRKSNGNYGNPMKTNGNPMEILWKSTNI